MRQTRRAWRRLHFLFFFFGIRICYTLHVCKYEDACVEMLRFSSEPWFEPEPSRVATLSYRKYEAPQQQVNFAVLLHHLLSWAGKIFMCCHMGAPYKASHYISCNFTLPQADIAPLKILTKQNFPNNMCCQVDSHGLGHRGVLPYAGFRS